MDNTDSVAKVIPYRVDGAPKGVPEVVEVHYDVWNLRVSLDFKDWQGMVYVNFEGPRGFRVLDEGDLIEMWGDRPEIDEWLNTVQSDGWIDQELERPGFLSLTTHLTEFLIVGMNDCVSVMAFKEPTVNIISAKK